MKQPRVGIAVLVIHDGQLLLGWRHKTDEPGSWQLPGGFMATGETAFDAATRLAWEKAKVRIRPVQQGPYTNNIFPDEYHTVSLYVQAELLPGQITQQAADGWRWCYPGHLPHPLFYPLQLLFEGHTDWLKSIGIFK